MYLLNEWLARWYDRSHGRVARVGVAALAGAIVAIVSGLTHRPGFAKDHWEILGFAGLLVGAAGGLLLGAVERYRAAHDRDPPYIVWSRRALVTLATLAAAALVPVFVYTMWLVATT